MTTSKPPTQFVDALGSAFEEAVLRHVEKSGRELSPAKIGRVLQKANRRIVKDILSTMDSRSETVLRQRHRNQRRFEARLYKVWGAGLDQLELLTHAFWEYGRKFFADGFLPPHDPSTPQFRALCELHARACRVGAEIFCLLRAGLADGANARWRTLHELAVVADILSTQPPEVAERYLLHGVVEGHRAATQYHEHAKALRHRPLPAPVLVESRRRKEELLTRFGKEFEGDYGWASGIGGKKRLKFADLEAAAGLVRWRPFYKVASERIHAGMRGLKPFGIKEHGTQFLLAGAINAGLADPGQNTVISLCHISAALMHHRPSLDNQVNVEVLVEMAERCMTTLSNAHRKVERLRKRDRRPKTNPVKPARKRGK
jgi:hypothetical protein